MRPLRHAACAVAALGLVLLAACATRALNAARVEFYAGHFQQADTLLQREPPSTDRVLYLMERGTIRLSAGSYTASADDFIAASAELDRLQAYSLSRGGASMIANDTVQYFKGYPFERTLVHTFAAKAHLAQGHWENAAVEARRTLQTLSTDARGDYPDLAYARYVAGLSLELANDRPNAELQYRSISNVPGPVVVDEKTGRFAARAGTNAVPAFDRSPWEAELVCFIMAGRGPSGHPHAPPAWADAYAPYAEIEVDGRVLGRSYSLTDTLDLAFTSAQRDAIRKAVKTAARIATKEVIAYQIEQDNELLGALVRLVLIGLLERPDTRRWETLPRHLQVARVPCPPDLTSFTVVFKNRDGRVLTRHTVQNPIARQGTTYISFCRDLLPR